VSPSKKANIYVSENFLFDMDIKKRLKLRWLEYLTLQIGFRSSGDALGILTLKHLVVKISFEVNSHSKSSFHN